MPTIRVASRASRLALTQSQQVINALVEQNKKVSFKIVQVTTRGDQGDLSIQGAFTNAIEQALVNGEADIAIHSLKDLPTQFNQHLCIAAVPKRADVRDVLISEKYNSLDALPNKAIIGTGSPRRKAQLQAINPTWNIEFINGNIDTRIQKLKSHKYDAIVLAAAGLIRMGWEDKITAYLPVGTMIPAPAQGALAIQCRKNEEEIIKICQTIHCQNTSLCVNTERKILHGIGGGCQLPIGALVEIEDTQFTLNALFGTLKNHLLNSLQIKHPLKEIEARSTQVIKKLTEQNVI